MGNCLSSWMHWLRPCIWLLFVVVWQGLLVRRSSGIHQPWRNGYNLELGLQWLGAMTAAGEDMEEEWVTVDRPRCPVPLELFPRQHGGKNGTRVDYGEVELVNSTLELDESKTWVIVQRDGESDALAWSPCDGQRIMMPYEVASEGEGLLLAPGSEYELQEGLGLVDYEEEAVYICVYHAYKFWIHSSLTNQWESLDDTYEQPECVFDEEEGTELGKLYFHAGSNLRYNPKLKVNKGFPRMGEELGFHWYKGVFYGISLTNYNRAFTLFKWGAWWEEVDSCPVYQQGERVIDKDSFSCSGGGRYICITQFNRSYLEKFGRFMVVYDLDEKEWHYHTLKTDDLHGWTTALVCNRGSYKQKNKSILDSMYKAAWLSSEPLPLPPVPVVDDQNVPLAC